MSSSGLGTSISAIEVTNITRRGFWLLIDDQKYFLPFTEFLWFRTASVAAIFNVQRLHPEHLYWPELDVDLELDAIRHPERYPLLAREQS